MRAFSKTQHPAGYASALRGNQMRMPVTTGGMEPAQGRSRILWWLAFAFGLACVVAALITGRGGIAGGGVTLLYPLQRLFWSKPGTDPSKSSWQRTRDRFDSGRSE